MQGTGIFGGSFNPIHNGHIALAKTLLNVTGLDEIWFMVSPQNPLKQQAGLLDDTTRLEMARTALTGEPQLAACDSNSILQDHHIHGVPCNTCRTTIPTAASH